MKRSIILLLGAFLSLFTYQSVCCMEAPEQQEMIMNPELVKIKCVYSLINDSWRFNVIYRKKVVARLISKGASTKEVKNKFKKLFLNATNSGLLIRLSLVGNIFLIYPNQFESYFSCKLPSEDIRFRTKDYTYRFDKQDHAGNYVINFFHRDDMSNIKFSLKILVHSKDRVVYQHKSLFFQNKFNSPSEDEELFIYSSYLIKGILLNEDNFDKVFRFKKSPHVDSDPYQLPPSASAPSKELI